MLNLYTCTSSLCLCKFLDMPLHESTIYSYLECCLETSIVSYILTECKIPTYLMSREQNKACSRSPTCCEQTTHIKSKHLIFGVLLCKTLLSLFECIDGFFCPPWPEDTIFIVPLACMEMYMALYDWKMKWNECHACRLYFVVQLQKWKCLPALSKVLK